MARSPVPVPPGTDEVLGQLASIIKSPTFRGSPLLRRLLTFCVEQSLDANPDSLDATIIGRRALGKASDFMSSRNASVRVAMNRLRKALQLYYANEGVRDHVLIRLEPRSYRPVFAWRVAAKPVSAADLALQVAASYSRNISRDENARALRVLKDSMQPRNRNPALLASYAGLCIDAYKFRFDTVQRPLEEADAALELAATIQPEYPDVLLQNGFLSLINENTKRAVELGSRLMQLGRAMNNVEIRSKGAFLVGHTTIPLAGGARFEVAPAESIGLPGWLYLPQFLAAYDAKDYPGALDAAVNFGMPDFFWGPVLRAAAFAQLGLTDPAHRQLSRSLALNPHFAKNPAWHLGQHIKHQDTLDHVLDGLYRARLDRRSSVC